MLKKEFVLSNFAVFVTLGIALLSSFFLLIGCIYYHITPWYNLKEVGYQQQQNELKNNFTNFHNDLGIQFLFAGRVDAATNEFTKILEVDRLNQNATRYLVLCGIFNNTTFDFYNFNNFDDEITRQQLDALIIETPNDPLLYFYSGNLAHSKGYLDDAITYYQKAIDLSNCSFAAAYHSMGIVNDQKNEHNLSLENFAKAVRLSPKTWIYNNDLADEFYTLEDYDNSTTYYSKAIRLNPFILLPYFGISKSFRCLGDLETASAMQERQITLMEVNYTKYLPINQKGLCYPRNSRNLEFICLNTYDEIQYYCYYSTALTYYLLGNGNKTLEYLQKADDLHLNIKLKSKVKEILNYDIENLQKAQSQNITLVDKTNEFRNNYLQLDQIAT
jgi:tetratricopeptide (TPR) repeat protein